MFFQFEAPLLGMYQNTCRWSPGWLRTDPIAHKVNEALRPAAWSSAMMGVFLKAST